MNNRNIINDYLSRLGKILDVNLRLESNGVCAIQIEEGLPFIIEVPESSKLLGKCFYLCAPLKPISGDVSEVFDLFGKSLVLNMFQIETGGGALAYSERLQAIVYCWSVPIEGCDAARFARIITDFITNARKLKKELMEEVSVTVEQDL